MPLVSTGCLSPWPKTVKVVNYLASPLSLRPCVQPTANFYSWRWGRIILIYMFPSACIPRSKALQQYEYTHTYIYEVSVFLCRVTINGIMTWWSSGQAATGISRTPTWSRGTAPPASPGHFNGQRKLARWDTITHPEYHFWPYSSFSPSALKIIFKRNK